MAVGGLPDFCGGLLGDVTRSVLQGARYLLQLCQASQLLHTVCPSGRARTSFPGSSMVRYKGSPAGMWCHSLSQLVLEAMKPLKRCFSTSFFLEEDQLLRTACDGKQVRAEASGPLQYSPLHLLGKVETPRNSINRVRKCNLRALQGLVFLNCTLFQSLLLPGPISYNLQRKMYELSLGH